MYIYAGCTRNYRKSVLQLCRSVWWRLRDLQYIFALIYMERAVYDIYIIHIGGLKAGSDIFFHGSGRKKNRIRSSLVNGIFKYTYIMHKKYLIFIYTKYIFWRVNGIYFSNSCNLQLMDSLSLFKKCMYISQFTIIGWWGNIGV